MSVELSKMNRAKLIAFMEESYEEAKLTEMFGDNNFDDYTKAELLKLISENPLPPVSEKKEDETEEDEKKQSRDPTPAERRAMKNKKNVHYPRRLGRGVIQTGKNSLTTGG